MELRHIRYFLAVAEERNFTRAAARLHIAQPPLSQQIKDLEKEIDVILFHRVATGAELTEAGVAFREAVADIPMAVGRGILSAQRAARGELGTINVGFTGTAIFTALVPRALKLFRRAYPEVQVSVTEMDSGGLVDALVDGRVDIAFLRWSKTGDEPFHMTTVGEEALLLVLPVDHPAAHQDSVPLEALREDTFILFPQSSGPIRGIVEQACRSVGFEPRIGPPVLQIGSIVSMVAAEFGVSLVPASMRQLGVDGVVFRDVSGTSLKVPIAVGHRRGDTSSVVRNFIRIAEHRGGEDAA